MTAYDPSWLVLVIGTSPIWISALILASLLFIYVYGKVTE